MTTMPANDRASAMPTTPLWAIAPATSAARRARPLRSVLLVVSCALTLAACAAETPASGGQAASATDAGAVTADAGTTDGPTDGAATDAGAADSAAAADTAPADVGAPDVAEDAGASQGTYPWGKKYCKKAGSGVGFGIGQQLGNLAVQDCDTGAARSIEEVCGADATWLFVAHSHCPTCRATASYTKQLASELADKNIAIVHIVHIDDGQTCQSWRAKYQLGDLPNVRVYEDKTNASWLAIKTKNYTAPHAIMGPDRVITFKAHGLSAGAVKNKLLAALPASNP